MNDAKAGYKECTNSEDPLSLEEIKANLFMFKQNNYWYYYLIDNIYTYIYGNNEDVNAQPINLTNPLTRIQLSNSILEQIKTKYRQIHGLDRQREVPVAEPENRPIRQARQRQVPEPENRPGRQARQRQVAEPENRPIRQPRQRQVPVRQVLISEIRSMIDEDRRAMISMLSLIKRNHPQFYNNYDDGDLRNVYEHQARRMIINRIVGRNIIMNDPYYNQTMVNRASAIVLEQLENDSRRDYEIERRDLIRQIQRANRILIEDQFDNEHLLAASPRQLSNLYREMRNLLIERAEQYDHAHIFSHEEYNRMLFDDLIQQVQIGERGSVYSEPDDTSDSDE